MPDQQSSIKAVVGVTAFYMTSALVMVMTNKWVLNTSSLPLTFLLLQLSLSVFCLTCLSFLPSTNKFAFVPPRWNRQTIMAVTPVCTANVVGLVFNIYCLKLVDASYFQVARGLTLPMTVVLQSLMTGERPSAGTIASCGIVTWGFTYAFLPSPFPTSSPIVTLSETAAVADTSNLGVLMQGHEAPMLGMILGVLSAAMVAIHAVLIKAALRSVDGRTLDLAYWQNALSVLVLIPGVFISGELGTLVRTVVGEEGDLLAFVTGSILTGVVGFLICVAGLLSIKITSPVTHMFSSAVRSVLQTILGVWLFKDILSANRSISILLILIGSILYTYLKSRSRPASPTPASPRTAADSEQLLKPHSQDPEKGEDELLFEAALSPRPSSGSSGDRSPPGRRSSTIDKRED